MPNKGLKQVRKMTGEGFYYENLIKMAQQCRAESSPDKILSAYIFNRFFSQLAEELGNGPVILSELRKLEARYRTTLNLALEAVVAGSPQEEQNNRLIKLIQLLWSA